MMRDAITGAFLIAFLACQIGDDDMGLPTSRNTTYAPGSQVKSADLNEIQDKIILEWSTLMADEAALAARIGASGALVMPAAPTAPDYHLSASQAECIPIFLAMSNSDWLVGLTAGSGVAGATSLQVPIIGIKAGDIFSVAASIQQANAVSGGNVHIVSVDQTGAVTPFVSFAILPLTTRQVLTASGGTAAAGNAYYLTITFVAGAGPKEVYGVEKIWTR